MSVILDKINSLNLKSENIKMYEMNEIKLGMQVDNNIKPIYIKHIPTDTVVIFDEYKSSHKNVMGGLEELEKKLKGKDKAYDSLIKTFKEASKKLNGENE